MAQMRRIGPNGQQELPEDAYSDATGGPDLPSNPGMNGWDGNPDSPLPPKASQFPPVHAGNSYGPRENQPDVNLRPLGPGAASGGAQATPPRPMQPTPQAGSLGPPAGPPEVSPQPPMAGPDLASTASPRKAGMFGGSGGLTGGGLGVPGGTSGGPDPISALIQQLLQNRG